MCGIVGWVKAGGSDSSSGLVKAMADCIAHRGPDDEGFFFAPGVGFGHRRLSIIDLEHGHQPMTAYAGRFTIVYNGEVYNFMDLRRQLEKLGERFLTHSDTEVVLRAFCRWGPDAVNRFKGMFAFAIWDGVERTLHLVRDHLGIKPLYYAEIGSELLFASEIKAIFCHPKIKRRIDPAVMTTFLAFNNTFDENSFWLGIKRCQPGERLEWHNGRMRSFRFFDVHNFAVLPFKSDFREASVKYREQLSDSVRDHLVSDVPLGSYLSAGFDSSSVAVLANRHFYRSLPVFTGYFSGYENGWYDERPAAKELSVRYGMTHYQCPITWQDFAQKLEKVCYHLDEPTLGSGSVPQFIVAEFASRKVKVVLTGHGGDELFAGYPVFKSVFMRTSGLGMKWLACLTNGSIDERMRVLYFLLGAAFDPVFANGQARMFSFASLKRVLSQSLVNSLKQNGANALARNFRHFSEQPTVDSVTRWYLSSYLPTLLIQEDKIGMAHGLESRLPICYESMINFALSLPDEIKLKGGRLKAVPKEAMRMDLPASFYSLPKRGFPTPIIDWLSTQLGQEWEQAWKRSLPGPLEGLLNPGGVLDEFRSFHSWGRRMPNAYILAHRLVSLQTLFACAKTMDSIACVDDFELFPEVRKSLSGPLILC